MKRILLSSFLTIIIFVSAFAQSQNFYLSAPFEDLSSQPSQNKRLSLDVFTKQIRSFTLNSSVLSSDDLKLGDTLTLNLFREKTYPSIIIDKTLDVNGVITIVSQLTEYNYSYCFISMSDGKLVLSVDIPERNEYYVTRYQAGRDLYLIQMDETKKNELEGAPSIIPPASQGQPIEKFQDDSKKNHGKDPTNGSKNTTSCLGSSDFARINILIVYTPAASSWATTNDGGINNTIAGAISRANTASANSNLNIHYNLAHSAQVIYTEVDPDTDLNNITYGNIPNVHTLRDTYAADLVVLFSFENATGGLGWLLNKKNGWDIYGFSITRVQQASWSYTTIHEIAHNMGANHHKLQLAAYAPGPTAWLDWAENTWSAGWRWTDASNAKYCDLMTYEAGSYYADGITHTRVGYFSDPLISYQGVPTGHATDGNNARTMREVKHVISQYRDSTTLQYCTAQSGNSNYRISNVQLGNRTQSAGTEPYYDFSNCAVDVTIGTPIQITTSITNPHPNQQLLAWVDWNDNKTFDSGEQVYASSIGTVSQYVFNITPSIGTSLGLKRLRFRLHLASLGPNATPCGSSSHGQVQDFTLNVISTISPPDVPASFPIVGNATPCQNSSQWYQLPSDASATFFNWSFPSDWTIINPNQIVAGWNFENATKRAAIPNNAVFISDPYKADSGMVANIDISPLSLKGGAEFTSWTTGAPNSNKWDNGTDLKYWQITCSTVGYDYLTLSSKQRSSNTGPKNFKVQYSVDALSWSDISGALVTVADNFTTGVLNNIGLPRTCANQETLYLRWIMTTNTSANGSTVGTTGTSRIDDIYLSGKNMSRDSVKVLVGTQNGNIIAFPVNSAGNGATQTMAVTTTAVPEQPISSGNPNPCQGATGLTYTVDNVSGVTYTWTVPTDWNITSGQGTNSIIVTAGSAAGNIVVTPSNHCGDGTVRSLAVTTTTVPIQTSLIAGISESCEGTTGLIYSVTNTADVIYTWSVPAGWTITSGQYSNTITVTSGTTAGNITVTPSNTCGNGTLRTLAVTTSSVPAQPSIIGGNINPCQGTTGLSYSVTNITGVTYTWIVPTGWIITSGQNTNTITVTAGTTVGNITVTPSNTCGNGTARTLAVTTSTVPAQPSVIGGNLTPCQGTTGLIYSVTNVAGVTYTWSVPTGWSITSGQNTNSITVTAGSAAGNITVTPSNSCGNGTSRTLAVTTTSIPAQPSVIAGNVEPCQGTTGLTYSVTNINGVTYTWSVPTGWIISNGQGTNSITVTAGTTAGDISVTPSNSCGNGTIRTLEVTIGTVPAQPSVIGGNLTPCQGTTDLIYSVTNVAGVTYTWTVPTGWTITSGQNTNIITVTAGSVAGNITVTPSNSCGNGTSRTLAVTTTSIPAQPSVIAGNVEPCQGTTGLTYSVTNINGVTYTWSVPTGWIISNGQGTNSITVTAGTTAGDITVIPSNTCGNGIAQTLSVTIGAVPAQPSVIGGNLNPCQGTTGIIYSVTNVAGVFYTWTVPTGWSITSGQNTNIITVTAGSVAGNITVTPSNSCGNGTASTLAVTTSSVPAQPSVIAGNVEPCQGAAGLTYSVTNITGVTYSWIVPSGWNITSGQNTNTITVTAGTTAGNITVTPSNSCGNGTARTLAVATSTVPAQPSVIGGNLTPCQGTTGLIYSVTNVAGVTYTWSVPTGWSITSGQNTNSITVTAGSAAGNITVTPSNSCGNGTSRTLAVTTTSIPAQPSVIAGNVEPCQGTTGLTYSVTNINGVTYAWTVPTGWTITSGQNTNSITVTAGSVAGNITVTPSNSCGNGTSRTLAVTTTSIPAQPSVIAGNVEPCQGTTGLTYSVTNINGVTYTWSVPTGWIISNGQGTNSITVTAGTTAGDISVTPSNSCGNGTIRTLEVTIGTVPAQPSVIGGNLTPCQGTTGLIYSVTNVAGVTYTWTVPTGWTITSGQNTNIITVTAGSVAGNITVTPSNSCGNGTASTLAVATSTVPAQPSIIGGNLTPCQGTTGLIYSVTNVAGVTYTWIVPTGWTITSGQNTNSITVTSGTIAGNITVTPSNTCGNGTARTLAVTTSTVPAQPSIIGGNINPCQGTTGLSYSVTNITGVTYTWSVPTGWDITGGQGTNAITVTAGSAAGNITVTPSNSCGNGTVRTLAVTTSTVPAQPSIIGGNINPCQGTTGLSYSVTNITGVTYTWSVPTGWDITGGQGTNAITVTAGTTAGNITVTPSNSCGNGTARTLAVTTSSVPAQPSIIEGNINPCQGATGLTYSVTNINGVTYNWTVPTGWTITSGQGTNSITLTAGTTDGNITVTPSNSCGNGTASTLAVTTTTVPAQSSVIGGNLTPCQGTTGLIYSVTNVAGVTYAWTVPTGWIISNGQGTNSITVTAGTTAGDISVTPSNTCGNGTARTLAVTSTTVPAQPSVIGGNLTPCQGAAGLTYSVTNIAGVTYTWVVPTGWIISNGQGTNSITVTAGTTAGDVSVTPSNSCGNGTIRTLEITIGTVPAQPSVIAGNVEPCQGATGLTYSVTNITGITYIWSAPVGWSITTGQGTNTITVSAGSIAGNITVTPSNSCGDGTARTLEVSTIPIPNTPVITYNGNYLLSNAIIGNQWFFNNDPIVNATEQTHIPTQNGAYFTFVLLNGCPSDTSNVIHVANVGVNDIAKQNLIEVYPNPFSDEIHFKTSIIDDIDFQIVSTQGQILLQDKFNQYKTLILNHLSRGFYMIRFEVNGNTFIQKIVKQ